MKRLYTLGFAAAIALVSHTALAHDYALGDLKIEHPWARATVPAQRASGGFLKIRNNGAADRLVSASAGVSERVELHEMKMEGDVMKMREIAAIDLPAGGEVELKPGGLHVMFINLKAPLAEGSSFPMTLKFEKAGEIKLDMRVEALKTPDAKPHKAMSH
ncbi:copper chaperone PCu(A)C [Niveibacterium sp. 24ML]|uniref:copper chaperone PCu(A)C n=1 Tax=Niveibacterium sp. 24ML TaxID=2985512 RepID=UPI002270EF0E|nr:copper chaperone PCu(A)C [Niveibacterium sp. 24ML]MCX9155328.1 copper chaperone PCu(A)C [Niveibacterium sp. 24ML]